MQRAFLAALLVIGAMALPVRAGERVCLDPGLVHLSGTWEQVAQGRVIATKIIRPTPGGMVMEYTNLQPGMNYGDYSVLSPQGNGSLVTFEDYGSHITKHTLTVIDRDTLRGHQRSYGRGNPVTNYTMRRVGW